MFLHFFSIFAKCQSQKGAKKIFEKFYCFFLLRMTQKFSFFFFFKKFKKTPKVGPVLGPFGPKTQNTTHQSSITPLLHSFYLSHFIIIQKIIENGQAVLEIFNFEKSSDLIGRAVFVHFRLNTIFPEKSDSATFYPWYPSNFMQKIRKK